MDSDPSLNPTFASFHRVIFWYCDGASFSGDRTEPFHYKPTNQTLYFRGKRVLELLMETLVERHELASATDVLVSGGSAGGLSAFLHADRVHALLRANGGAPTKFRAAPVSGFFLMHDAFDGRAVYPDNMKYAFNMQNASDGVHAVCVGALPASEAWRCIFANYSYAVTQTPMFPLQSMLDNWQMGNIWYGDTPCVKSSFHNCTAAELQDLNAFGAALMADLRRAPKFGRAGEGGFVESCLEHCGAQSASHFTNYAIDGTTLQQALSRWWAADAQPASKHWHLPCSLTDAAPHQCNPSCEMK